MTLLDDTRRSESFRSMGTQVTVYGPAGRAFARSLPEIVALFEAEERRFSRFRGDSELAELNRRAGSWTAISEVFEEVLRCALAGAARSGGTFDPSVLGAVIDSGYDRDFDEVLAGARGVLHPSTPCARWREIEVRPGWVLLPPGVGLDLGGLVKGWTADRATDLALGRGLPWVLVSAGGDQRIAGSAPVVEIPIEDPERPDRIVTSLRIDRGAIASSSTAKRTWGSGLHHVIDPRTGAPAETDAVQVTVWAPTCAEAEILATWALISGVAAAEQIPAAIVGVDGAVTLSFAPGSEGSAA
ncbi:MAG TPA: FAD:protein FMN transferase [Actinomycetota bacterium]